MNNLRKLISVRIYIVSFLEALLAVACFTGAVFINRPIDAPVYFEYEGGAIVVGFVALTTLIISYLLDFYRQSYIKSRLTLLLDAFHLMGCLLLVSAVVAFVSPGLMLLQAEMLIGSALFLLVLVPWRLAGRPAMWNAFGAETVLFVGCSPTMADVAAEFEANPGRGMTVAGYVIEHGDKPPGKVLGTQDRLAEIITEISPDRVVVDGTVTKRSVLSQLLEFSSEGLPVQTSSQAYEWIFGRIDCRGLLPYTLLFLDDLKGRPASLAIQSVYTNLLVLSAAVVSLPAILVIALALKILRPGLVFAAYECIGLHGIPLRLYRFHVSDTDSSFLTRMLLRYKLDGLPQVVNLIRGELGLIGPRPENKMFDTVLHELIPFYRQKQAVRPGIFGWSQLHCDTADYEDTRIRLEYDLYYIKYVSVALDLHIMLRALKWIISGDRRGAMDKLVEGNVQVGVARSSLASN